MIRKTAQACLLTAVLEYAVLPGFATSSPQALKAQCLRNLKLLHQMYFKYSVSAKPASITSNPKSLLGTCNNAQHGRDGVHKTTDLHAAYASEAQPSKHKSQPLWRLKAAASATSHANHANNTYGNTGVSSDAPGAGMSGEAEAHHPEHRRRWHEGPAPLWLSILKRKRKQRSKDPYSVHSPQQSPFKGQLAPSRLLQRILQSNSIAELIGDVEAYRSQHRSVNAIVQQACSLYFEGAAQQAEIDRLFDLVSSDMFAQMSEEPIERLADTLWHMGRVRYKPTAVMFDGLCELLLQEPHLRKVPQQLLQVSSAVPSKLLRSANHHTMTKLCTALVWLDYRDELLWSAIASTVLRLLPSFPATELPQLLWCFSMMINPRHGEPVKALVNRSSGANKLGEDKVDKARWYDTDVVQQAGQADQFDMLGLLLSKAAEERLLVVAERLQLAQLAVCGRAMVLQGCASKRLARAIGQICTQRLQPLLQLQPEAESEQIMPVLQQILDLGCARPQRVAKAKQQEGNTVPRAVDPDFPETFGTITAQQQVGQLGHTQQAGIVEWHDPKPAHTDIHDYALSQPVGPTDTDLSFHSQRHVHVPAGDGSNVPRQTVMSEFSTALSDLAWCLSMLKLQDDDTWNILRKASDVIGIDRMDSTHALSLLRSFRSLGLQ